MSTSGFLEETGDAVVTRFALFISVAPMCVDMFFLMSCGVSLKMISVIRQYWILEVTSRASGLAHETGRAGVVYHILGANGATCATFSTPERIGEVIRLNPDLIILFFWHDMRLMAVDIRQPNIRQRCIAC